jgi:hypothetical protein
MKKIAIALATLAVADFDVALEFLDAFTPRLATPQQTWTSVAAPDLPDHVVRLIAR